MKFFGDWERSEYVNGETQEVKDNQMPSSIHPFSAELLPKVEKKKFEYQEKHVFLRYWSKYPIS